MNVNRPKEIWMSESNERKEMPWSLKRNVAVELCLGSTAEHRLTQHHTCTL